MVNTLRHPRTALAEFMRSSPLGLRVLNRLGIATPAAPATPEEVWADGRPTNFRAVWSDGDYQKRFRRYASRNECKTECDFLFDVGRYRAAASEDEQNRLCELYIGTDALRLVLAAGPGSRSVATTGQQPLNLESTSIAEIARRTLSAPGGAKVFDAAAADVMAWLQENHYDDFMASLPDLGRG